MVTGESKNRCLVFGREETPGSRRRWTLRPPPSIRRWIPPHPLDLVTSAEHPPLGPAAAAGSPCCSRLHPSSVDPHRPSRRRRASDRSSHCILSWFVSVSISVRLFGSPEILISFRL
ncbi:hypothetical protein BRADI_3g39392v3 [Brachypodium distachyon]|uniref:Uncharacterized protein n=1 Tax=Brachypodium distachyon TaxID=15368 RepID=A0A2K2D249_BRADI|nr:hypothetical protein BRADI_3g39392v3 [Brachypodium distachyon]